MAKPLISNAYLSTFCLELAMLTSSGIALTDGFAMMHDDEPTAEGKMLFSSVRQELEKGVSLSQALQQTEQFPEHMIAMLNVGERTGRSEETLQALAVHYERQESMQFAIKNALIYPSILLVMMVIVVVVLIVYVMPIFSEVFNRLGTHMSPVAIGLMQFGIGLRAASGSIALLFGVIGLLFLAVVFVPSVKAAVTGALLGFFAHRGVFSALSTSQFTSAVSLALASGLSSRDAVELAAGFIEKNKVTIGRYNRCLNDLEEGHSLAEALVSAEIVSARNGRVLALGSLSGLGDTAMAEVAAKMTREAQMLLDSLIAKIEPTMVIITSLIVGLILLTVMLPLVSIMTSIG